MRDGSSNLNSQREKPLASLSVILRLLAELSKSYAAIARLIVDYKIDLTAFGSTARQYIMVCMLFIQVMKYVIVNSKMKFDHQFTTVIFSRMDQYWHSFLIIYYLTITVRSKNQRQILSRC